MSTVQIYKTPFEYFGDAVSFCKSGGVFWFETEAEALDEFPADWILWAADFIKANP